MVVEGEKIVSIGENAQLREQMTIDEEIDLEGMYVLPGLWDMHVHLDYQGLKDVAIKPTIAERTLFSYRRALTLLNSGVTSLRVVSTYDGIDFTIRDGINSGRYLGPRILTSGEGISSTGGHGSPDGTGYDGPYQFRQAARKNLWRGADLVKLMVTGGIAGKNEAFDAPQTLEDEVAAAIDIAHKWGKHVAGHIASAQAAIMCAKAGIDTVEHGYALSEEALTVMKECGTAYVPTLVVTDNPSYWQEIGTAEWAVAKIKQAYESHHRAAEMAIKMGIPITIGSDVPSTSMDGAVVAVREMEALAKLGASPKELISWGTKVAAKICGVYDEVGTLEQGKTADLIAVPNNPYESVSNLRDVRFVMIKGAVVRKELSAAPAVGIPTDFLENS